MSTNSIPTKYIGANYMGMEIYLQKNKSVFLILRRLE